LQARIGHALIPLPEHNLQAPAPVAAALVPGFPAVDFPPAEVFLATGLVADGLLAFVLLDPVTRVGLGTDRGELLDLFRLLTICNRY